jgi:hypothetical protein
MKLLKFKAIKEYASNEYLFKYKKYYFRVEHDLRIDRKNIYSSYIYFGYDPYIIERNRAKVTYYHCISIKDRTLTISHNSYVSNISSDDVYRIYIKNKISNNNYSKRKVLRECFYIYEVFTQKI